jgi:hypothetical protein
MLDVAVTQAGVQGNVTMVERAVHVVAGPAVVLPPTELSGFRGYPLVEWTDGLEERLRTRTGPVLDRATLTLWESWPSGVDCAPPPAPLRILGFASTASWRHALRACRELRGFGPTCVVTGTRPSRIRLAEADLCGVFVIEVFTDGEQVLVHGRPGGQTGQRMVATRYWEERLFGHAMRVGALRSPRLTVRP